MASRSLGTLTLDLVAKIGGYTEGLGKAEREAEKRAKAIERAFSNAGTAIGVGLSAAITGAVAGLVAFDKLIKSAADFQDIAEKIGGSAEGIASFGTAAGTAGVDIETIAAASVKLTSALVGVDDESKAAGAAIKALGLDLKDFKSLSPEDQIEAVAKALSGFEDGANKTAVAVALFGKSGAQLLPFLKALEEQGGRQVILTEQQIQLADQYADAQAKAAAELRQYAQLAATQALPALTSLTKVLNDVALELIGVDKQTGVLAANNGIKVFAENAISAVAFVIDSFNGLFTVVSRTGEFIGATGAALVAVLSGDFKALDAIRKSYDDSLNQGFDSLRSRVQEQFSQVQNLTNATASITRKRLNFDGAADKGKKAKDPYAEAQRYLESLQKQVLKVGELTVAEQALAEIRSGRLGKITADQEKQILYTAEQIDTLKALEKAMKDTEKANEDYIEGLKRSNKENQDWLEGMLSGGPIAKLEKQRADLQRLADLVDKGIITPEQFSDAATGYLGLQGEIKETKSLADELGLSFTSAFEDAIVGGKGFSEVLKGLEQDIIRIVTRKLVTEPLGNALTGMFNGSGGGGGAGGFLSGIFNNVGGFFKNLFSFDGGGFTGSGPRAGGLDGKGGFMAMLHPNETVSDHTKGQGGTININVGVQGMVDQRTRQQIGAEVALQLQRAERNL